MLSCFDHPFLDTLWTDRVCRLRIIKWELFSNLALALETDDLHLFPASSGFS